MSPRPDAIARRLGALATAAALLACGDATAPRARRFEAGLVAAAVGPTGVLAQRSLAVRVKPGSGLRGRAEYELAVDPGTPRARVLRPGAGEHVDFRQPASDAGWEHLYLNDTLASGPHRVVVRLYDDGRLVDSITFSFTIEVLESRYALALLPSLGGDADAWDVNASGQVAGWASASDGAQRAALWRDGQLEALPAPDTAVASGARGLNDAGDAVGFVIMPRLPEGYRPVRPAAWRGGRFELVTWRGSPLLGSAKGIADGGEVLVYTGHVGVYRDGEIVRDLYGGRQPLDFNDRQQVVGHSGDVTRWSAVGWGIAFPTIGFVERAGAPAAGSASQQALAVNNAEQVLVEVGAEFVGTSPTLSWYVLSKAGGSAVDVTAAFRAPNVGASAVALSESGTVLAFEAATGEAYLRAPDGAVRRVRLDAPGWRLDRVAALNDHGQIVGHATDASTGRRGAVLLTPVP